MSSEAEPAGADRGQMSAANVTIAVAGVGGWGRNVLKSFGSVQGAQLVAVCDPDAGRLAAASAQFPDARTVSDYAELLSDPALDAIALATPAEMHYPMARAALDVGKHVFVEKPLTLSAADAEELVALADRAGRKLMVGHLLEYHPAIEVMKQQIESGEIGDVLYIATRRLNLGVIRRAENAFWSLAPHDISIVLYLLGQEPERVNAQGACYVQRGIEDVVFANLTFADGKMAQIHVSWLDPRKVREIVVVGTRRMLVFDETAAAKLVIHDKSATLDNGAVLLHNGPAVAAAIPNLPPLDIEAQHFIDSIRFDRTPRSDGRDGLRVVRVLEQVDRILRQARVGAGA